MKDLFKYFFLPFYAIIFNIKHRELRKYTRYSTLISFLMLGLLLAGFIWGGVYGAKKIDDVITCRLHPCFEECIDDEIPAECENLASEDDVHRTWWQKTILGTLDVVVIVGLIFFLIYFFPVIFSAIYVIAIPFITGPMYEKALEIDAGKPIVKIEGVWGNIRITVKSIGIELVKIIFYLFLSLFLFLLNIIGPVGTTIYAIAGFFLSGLFLGWDMLMPAFEIKNWSFKQQRKYIFSHKGAVIGNGMGCFLLLYVPIINIFFMNTNIMSGALAANRMGLADIKDENDNGNTK